MTARASARSDARPIAGIVVGIVLSVSAMGCGAGDDSAQGVGRISVGRSISDGSVFLAFYFAPFQLCAALPRDDRCSVEYVDTCWPAPGPQARLPNAGTISATDGKETRSYVPDADGWYRSSSGGKLDPEAALTIVATGDSVPAFQAEISLPHGSLAPQTPARSSQVSRTAPLPVEWTGTTDAERAGITIQMVGGFDASRIVCQPSAQPPHFEMPIAFANALVPGARTVLGVAPANVRKVTVKGWTIDVIANGAGSGHAIQVEP